MGDYGPVVSYPPPQRRPPSKYLALWISLPVIALVACCGGIGAFLDSDDEADGKPQPVASIAGVPETSTSAPNTTPTPSTAPTSDPSASATATATTSPPPAARTTTTTRPPAPPTTRTTTRTTPPSSVYYANCDAVRAAGKAPLYRGEPGYRAGLDGDGDGVACEKK